MDGHPHHQFRSNTLLISKLVFDIVCKNNKATTPGATPLPAAADGTASAATGGNMSKKYRRSRKICSSKKGKKKTNKNMRKK